MWKVRKNLLVLLMLFVLFDFGHSSYKYFHQPLFGDIVPLVLPDSRNAPVLSDPFGFKAFATDVYHPNINRFFCAYSLYHYMQKMPLVLQKVVDPVQSLYLSTTLLKVFLHAALLILLAFIVAPLQAQKRDLGLLLFILTPFFIIGTYLRPIGIVDASVVYAFFYALPFVFFLIFILPFIRMIKKRQKDLVLKKWEWIGMFILMLILSFSSAILPPVVLIGGGLFLAFEFFKNSGTVVEKLKAMPKHGSLIIGIFVLLSLYSFYLGLFNSESVNKPALAVRYAALGQGMVSFFLKNLAVQILWLTIAVNYYLLNREKILVWERPFKNFLFPLLIFCLAYMFLMPLGGYRVYRPEILRADTMIPVTLSGFFLLSLSTFYLLVHLKEKMKNYYLGFFLLLTFVFSFYDYGGFAKDKACEENALIKLSQATESPVRIEENCKIIDWTYSDQSKFYGNHVKLLQHWNVIDKDLLFYVKEK